MSTETTHAGIADLIASLPHMIGATPQDATVVVGLKGGQVIVMGQIYHEGGEITEQLDKAMRVMVHRGQCDAVLCAAFGMSEAQAAWSAECAAQVAGQYGLRITAQVHVEPELRMYADEAGHWHELPTVAQSQLLAHEAATVPSPATSRAAIVAEWTHHGLVTIHDHDEEPAMRALAAILAGSPAEPGELGSLAGWLAMPAHRDDTVQVIAQLGDMTGHAPAIPAPVVTQAAAAAPATIQRGLRQACAALCAPASTQLLTIAAAHSYRHGNGMIARIQAEAAIATGGNVRLAQLLLHAITEGIRPPQTEN